jgi:hypothetical protein
MQNGRKYCTLLQNWCRISEKLFKRCKNGGEYYILLKNCAEWRRILYTVKKPCRMAEKYAGKLHLLKEDLKEKWGEVKETGIKTTVSNNVNVSNPITLLKMGGGFLSV